MKVKFLYNDSVKLNSDEGPVVEIRVVNADRVLPTNYVWIVRCRIKKKVRRSESEFES